METERLFGIAVLVFTAVIAQPAIDPEALGAPTSESIVTKDGVQLHLTYFPSAARPGTPEAKQVAPVVLLHDHKETRSIYNSLAQQLSSGIAPGEAPKKRPSFAVVVADLRGHGESQTQVLPDGSQIDLDAARLTKAGLQAMAALDMEAVRSFLIEKNDTGELNLNKLCILGAGMSANVAVNWAVQDWTAPPLAVGKQGQDVKALVLISPRWSFNGLSFQAPMRFRPLKENVAWLLMYGAEDPKVKADVERIRKQLARFHPEASDPATQAKSSLQVIEWPSKLQGSTLITKLGSQVDPKIVEFLINRVANRQQPWISRLNRLP